MLTLDKVSKAFGEQVLFSNLSHTFPQTGLFFVSGASGSGKTTLFRMIAGLDPAYTGTVNAPDRVAFLFQDRRLFDTLSALDNVLLSKSSAERKGSVFEAKALLSRLGFTEGDMKKKPPELSGGMQQRVAIARAIFFDAPLILLDEPTKELDEENRKILRTVIVEEAKKRLVLCSTHEDEDIRQMGGTVVPLA